MNAVAEMLLLFDSKDFLF